MGVLRGPAACDFSPPPRHLLGCQPSPCPDAHSAASPGGCLERTRGGGQGPPRELTSEGRTPARASEGAERRLFPCDARGGTRTRDHWLGGTRITYTSAKTRGRGSLAQWQTTGKGAACGSLPHLSSLFPLLEVLPQGTPRSNGEEPQKPFLQAGVSRSNLRTGFERNLGPSGPRRGHKANGTHFTTLETWTQPIWAQSPASPSSSSATSSRRSTAQNLSFLICKMGRAPPTSRGCGEEDISVRSSAWHGGCDHFLL